MDNLKDDILTIAEKRELASLIAEFRPVVAKTFSDNEVSSYRRALGEAFGRRIDAHDAKGLCKALITMRTAALFASEIDPDHNILLAILLEPLLREGVLTIERITADWGDDVASLIAGIGNVSRFSARNNVGNQENFRGLMLSLASDIRVIIIMIVRNLVLMRSINRHPDEQWVRDVAFEANCLYAQLAHRLGLY